MELTSKHDTVDSAEHAPDKRVHLPMANTKPSTTAASRPPWDRARWAVVGLASLAALLFAGSFFLAWWKFWLYAPQYPKGLHLIISLTGMGGDVREIDILNHYIGMKHLEDAAPTERQLAGYLVAGLGVAVLVLLALSGKRFNKLLAIPAIAFPIGFLADSFYWLYSFGHNLDPKAPIRLGAFTPQMFGNGQIGQFETFAQPAAGFWVAMAGVACAVAANMIRSRVCTHCVDRGNCGVVCKRLMVLPSKTEPQ